MPNRRREFTLARRTTTRRTTTRRGDKADFQIRRVLKKEDRKRPSVFLRLKPEEAFRGYALFEPDPEDKENPGYYEYYDHYDRQANQYVPCAGEKCPFCAANDNPSTRAMTVWFFPDAPLVQDRLKVFTANFSTTEDLADESEDEGGLKGKELRIKRLNDGGDYKVKVIAGSKLKANELKAAMAELDEKFPEGLEAIVMRNLKIQMERLKAMAALEEDEDEEEVEEKPRRGRVIQDEVEDEEEEEIEEEDEEEEEVEDEEEMEDEEDEDEEEIEEEEEEEEEAEDEEEEEKEIAAEAFEVVKVNERDEWFELVNDDMPKTKFWLGEGVEVDYSKIKVGSNVTVSALTDDEGDWIITKIALKRARSTGTKRRSK
jgi:hypothetical protein